MAQKVNAIANGYTILTCLSNQDSAQGVTEIARNTGISPSSCFNILKTLVDLGLASFDENTKGYTLGLGVFELARSGMSHNPILAIVQPTLALLSRRHNAVVALWEIIGDDHAVLIALGENSSPARIQLQIGHRQPIGAGSVGRVVLSSRRSDVERLKRAFNEVDWQGEISFEKYISDIRKAHQQGYAIDRDKFYLGISTVSALLGELIAGRKYCLTTVLFSGAHNLDSLKAIGQDLRSTAEKLCLEARGGN